MVVGPGARGLSTQVVGLQTSIMLTKLIVTRARCHSAGMTVEVTELAVRPHEGWRVCMVMALAVCFMSVLI